MDHFFVVLCCCTIELFLLVRTTPPPLHTQGHNNICSLPDSDLMEISGSCNFNNGQCGYEFPKSLWSIYVESYGGIIYGEIQGDVEGKSQTFAAFQSNDPKVNETVITTSYISSPTIYTNNVCLKFWFLMPNQNSKLQVFMKDISNNHTSLEFESKYTPAPTWRQIQIMLSSRNPYRVEFVSVKENNYAFVGIDHVQILIERPPTTTSPASQTTTHVETTIQSASATSTLERSTFLLPTISESHTTTTFTTTESPTSTKTTAMMFPSTTFITSFISTDLTTLTTSSTTDAKTALVTPSSTFRITELTTTESSTGTTTTTHCTCDCPTIKPVCADTNISTAAPSIQPKTLCDLPRDQRIIRAKLSCDFDHRLCGYNIPNYPHLWELAAYRYGNQAVGEILGDSSSNSDGGYLIFNTYNSHVQDQMHHAFQSPDLSAFTEYCVDFWYNMPNNQSKLDILARFSDQTDKLLWTTGGVQTNGWTNGYFAVRENFTYKLEFRATKESPLSFFAVDNLEVSAGKSNQSRITRDVSKKQLGDRFSEIEPVKNLVPITDDITEAEDDTATCSCTCPNVIAVDCGLHSNPPQPVPSCRDSTDAMHVPTLSCDFNNGNPCGYTLPVYPHLWELYRYRYGNETAGVIDGDASPDNDGFYSVFATLNWHVTDGETAEMSSPGYKSNSRLCISFMYNKPTKYASFAVYFQSSGKKELLFEPSTDPTNGWQRASIQTSTNTTFHLLFISKKTGLYSFFAIDDIEVKEIR